MAMIGRFTVFFIIAGALSAAARLVLHSYGYEAVLDVSFWYGCILGSVSSGASKWIMKGGGA